MSETRPPVVFISGRGRHFFDDGSINMSLLDREREDESKWGAIAKTFGTTTVEPLKFFRPLEGVVPDSAIIAACCGVISGMWANYDIILMRPHWNVVAEDDPRPDWYAESRYNASAGATLEREAARRANLRAAYGDHGEEAVKDYFRQLGGD